MSINKNAYLRYQVLDKCFSNKYKIYFIENLLDEVNKALEDFNGSGSKIERRQLFDDIKFMESEAGWSIPLERIKDGKITKENAIKLIENANVVLVNVLNFQYAQLIVLLLTIHLHIL